MLQKVKSNKKDCKQLARRAVETLHDIWRQTKDHGEDLPVEVQESIDNIERLVPWSCSFGRYIEIFFYYRIFRDVIAFMKRLENQHFVKRLVRQDDNKSHVE